MKASIFFRWYDLWVGAYWSREDRTLYICPLPMLGVKLDFRPRNNAGVLKYPFYSWAHTAFLGVPANLPEGGAFLTREQHDAAFRAWIEGEGMLCGRFQTLKPNKANTPKEKVDLFPHF